MRKCDFSNLKWFTVIREGEQKSCIDWKKSAGCKIPFVYDEIEGEFEIVEALPKQRVVMKYDGEDYIIATSQLHKGALGSIVGRFNYDYIYEINELLEQNGKAIVLDRFRKGKGGIKHYSLKCLDCNNTYDRSEGHVRNRGVKCPICGDGISYPQKFMTSVLKQLKVDFTTEYIINENKDSRYDFYIPHLNLIIEVHGVQHYNGSFKSYGGRTLEEEQENDRIKMKTALELGYNYIVINAKDSSIDWLKNSIEKSEMNTMFNLAIVNWEECGMFATSSFTKQVCEDFEDNDSAIANKLAIKYGVARTTIVRHLKKGAKFGWCDYDPQRIQYLNAKNKLPNSKKPVICIETGQEFESATECARVSLEVFGVKMLQSKISKVCNGMAKSHKGFTFKYRDNEEIDLSQFLKNETAQSICLAKQEDINLSTRKLARMFNVSRDSVVDYLKKGHILGLCHYDKDEEYRRENAKKNTNLKCKQVEAFKDGVSQGIFESVRYLSDNSEEIFGVKFAQCSIREVCLGRKKTHRGFTFKYVEEGGEEKCQVA